MRSAVFLAAALVAAVLTGLLVALAFGSCEACLAPPCPRGWYTETRAGVVWCVAPETSFHPGGSR